MGMTDTNTEILTESAANPLGIAEPGWKVVWGERSVPATISQKLTGRVETRRTMEMPSRRGSGYTAREPTARYHECGAQVETENGTTYRVAPRVQAGTEVGWFVQRWRSDMDNIHSEDAQNAQYYTEIIIAPRASSIKTVQQLSDDQADISSFNY